MTTISQDSNTTASRQMSAQTPIPGERRKAVLSVFTKIAIYVPLILFSILTLIPFVFMITRSFRAQTSEGLFLPSGDGFLGVDWGQLTLSNYMRLFDQGELGFSFARSILNSFFYASVQSVVATLLCAMGGYVLAKFTFKLRGFMLALVLGSLIVPGALMLAPLFQLIYYMGLLDSYVGLILPGLSPAFGVFLFRQSMISAVPDEILEASRIDGANEIRIFFTMVLPLVKPMIGALMLFQFLGTWNNFIFPQIILQSPENMPLAVAIAQLKGTYSQEYGMLMAGTLISIAPIMALFMMLQRDFIAGLTSGAVKG